MEYKVCNECNQELPISNFSKHPSCRDGYRPKCKACELELYRRTPQEIVKRMYAHQKENSIKRNHPLPNYTQNELKKWMLSQPNFNELFTNWVNSNYNPKLVPSGDRLDNKLPYTLDNLRLVTWAENHLASNVTIRKGIDITTHRPVMLYDMGGNFIAEFVSVSDCARYLNTSKSYVSKVCEGKEIKQKNPDGTYRYYIPVSVKNHIVRYK